MFRCIEYHHTHNGICDASNTRTGNFAGDPTITSNVEVKTGILGLTSHHGIHRNGFNNIEMKNVNVSATSGIVYFTGEYAHMRMLLPRYRQIETLMNILQCGDLLASEKAKSQQANQYIPNLLNEKFDIKLLDQISDLIMKLATAKGINAWHVTSSSPKNQGHGNMIKCVALFTDDE